MAPTRLKIGAAAVFPVGGADRRGAPDGRSDVSTGRPLRCVAGWLRTVTIREGIVGRLVWLGVGAAAAVLVVVVVRLVTSPADPMLVPTPTPTATYREPVAPPPTPTVAPSEVLDGGDEG